MLRRLIIIAFFTGVGQLFSIFALKYVAQYGSVTDLKAIAQIDSTVLLIMNVIALGLQSAAMRDLALSPGWKEEYSQIQSARVTLGILLSGLVVLAFINKYYLVFLIAPVIAWNGDYALYARGHAIAGSVIAILRLLIPFSAIMLMVHNPQGILPWIYLAGILLTYIVTNLSISSYLKTPVFFLPRFKNLHLYFKSLPLGIVVLSLYFIGLGLMLVIPYFYLNPVVSVTFLGLKFYVVFKGVLRIIHQAFIKEMVSYDVCFKVDQLASLIGLTFCSFMICFPNTFIRLFFGEKYLSEKNYFILMSVAAFIYSLFSSLIIKAMLEKKDKHYAWVSSISALLTVILCIIFSFFWQSAFAVGISLVAGETIFAAGMVLLMKRPQLLRERVLFFLTNIFFLVIPIGFFYFLGDTLPACSVTLGVFGLAIAARYFKKFNMPALN